MRACMLMAFTVLVLGSSIGSSSATGNWEVTMIGSHGDTIWVQLEAQVGDFDQTCVVGYDCKDFMYSLEITPCPLSVTCTGSTYYEQPNSGFLVFGLQAGIDYTFNGYFAIVYGGSMEIPFPPYYVCIPRCQETCNFNPFIFSAPVGTEPQSWGGIKALFK